MRHICAEAGSFLLPSTPTVTPRLHQPKHQCTKMPPFQTVLPHWLGCLQQYLLVLASFFRPCLWNIKTKNESKNAWDYFLSLSYMQENIQQVLICLPRDLDSGFCESSDELGQMVWWHSGTSTPQLLCSCSTWPRKSPRQLQAHTDCSGVPKLINSDLWSQHPHAVPYIQIHWHEFKIQVFIHIKHTSMVTCYSILCLDFLCSLIWSCAVHIW